VGRKGGRSEGERVGSCVQVPSLGKRAALEKKNADQTRAAAAENVYASLGTAREERRIGRKGKIEVDEERTLAANSMPLQQQKNEEKRGQEVIVNKKA